MFQADVNLLRVDEMLGGGLGPILDPVVITEYILEPVPRDLPTIPN